MNKVYIISAKRTAIGTFQGSLKDLSAVNLAKHLIQSILSDLCITVSDISEVILGNVLGAGQGQNIARQSAIAANLAVEVPAYTLNKVCGSGLKAVQLGYQSIAIGESDIVIAGGTENMNQAPFLLPKEARTGLRMGDSILVDSMIRDGLWCAINHYHMGITAENVAKTYHITREEQDLFAYESQQKAQASISSGLFKEEIVPVSIKDRKETKIFAIDEHPRSTTMEALSKLKPAFDGAGTVTAGNASGINDGAAVIVLASDAAVKRLGISPMARILGFASVGLDPATMGYGPVPAVCKLLTKLQLTLDEIDRFELNEAFAAQSLAVIRGLGLSDRLGDINNRGGAIALGHPIGASGARILVSLLHQLQQDRKSKGLAALCIGGGQGIAAIVEREA